jgi:hypothetical protein
VPRSKKDEAERLGRLVGDPERLLPGETPGTTDLKEAEHWLDVHAQLLQLREELLERLESRSAGIAEPAVAAGLDVNRRALLLTIRRSRARRSFWQRRVEALRGAVATAAPR